MYISPSIAGKSLRYAHNPRAKRRASLLWRKPATLVPVDLLRIARVQCKTLNGADFCKPAPANDVIRLFLLLSYPSHAQYTTKQLFFPRPGRAVVTLRRAR